VRTAVLVGQLICIKISANFLFTQHILNLKLIILI